MESFSPDHRLYWRKEDRIKAASPARPMMIRFDTNRSNSAVHAHEQTEGKKFRCLIVERTIARNFPKRIERYVCTQERRRRRSLIARCY
jgi:hypothetical protein